MPQMNMQQPNAGQVARRFRDFRRENRKLSKVFYGPLFSACDLNGIAIANNPLTRQLNAQELPFFQVGVGQQGQGYSTMTYAETNLDGGNGQLPAGFGYAAQSLGVYMPPQLPPHLKGFLTAHASLAHVRHSHRWEAGALCLWPEASYGAQSLSASTTIANSLVEYAVNGRVASRKFPEGGELYFPPNEQIKFVINTYGTVFVTTDGLTWNGGIYGVDPGGNGLPPADGAPLIIVMDGFRFEELTA